MLLPVYNSRCTLLLLPLAWTTSTRSSRHAVSPSPSSAPICQCIRCRVRLPGLRFLSSSMLAASLINRTTVYSHSAPPLSWAATLPTLALWATQFSISLFLTASYAPKLSAVESQRSVSCQCPLPTNADPTHSDTFQPSVQVQSTPDRPMVSQQMPLCLAASVVWAALIPTSGRFGCAFCLPLPNPS